MAEETWETQEVINWLTNDEGCYDALFRQPAKYIRAWVIEGNAPQGLYDQFNAPPKSSWNDVDWDAVEDALKE